MNLVLPVELAEDYSSVSQRIHVMTEDWRIDPKIRQTHQPPPSPSRRGALQVKLTSSPFGSIFLID